MLQVVIQVLPIILLLVLGNILKKFSFFKESTIEDLKKLVVNITLPSVLFLAFLNTEIESSYILIITTIFFSCIFLLLVGIVIRNLTKSKNRYFSTVFTSFENGMIGYSLFVTVYGTENMFKIAIIDLGHILFVFLILVSYLQKLNGQSASFKDLIIGVVRSPILIAVFAGIICSTTGMTKVNQNLSVTSTLLEVVTMLSTLTVPIICIVIGYELSITRKSIGKPLMASLLRLVILLGVAFLINTFILDRLLHLDPIFQMALYTTFILPPGFAIPIFMNDKTTENRQFILNMISIHIVLSIVAFLLLISFV